MKEKLKEIRTAIRQAQADISWGQLPSKGKLLTAELNLTEIINNQIKEKK